MATWTEIINARQAAKAAQAAARMDGLNAAQAALVCDFQRLVETNPNPNYERLQVALMGVRAGEINTLEACWDVYHGRK